MCHRHPNGTGGAPVICESVTGGLTLMTFIAQRCVQYGVLFVCALQLTHTQAHAQHCNTLVLCSQITSCSGSASHSEQMVVWLRKIQSTS